MITLFYNNQACRIDDDLTLVGGENCPTSIILVCDLANHALGGLRCPLCFPTRLCIPESDRPDFIVCPTITMGAYNPMPLWSVIACIIIKLAALCSALGEVYWCCGTQFVHCSRLASRQKAKLYPANTLAHLPASLQPTPPLEIQPSSKPLASLAKKTFLNNLKNCLSLHYRRGAVIVRPCSQC